jgi:hypothetical protein
MGGRPGVSSGGKDSNLSTRKGKGWTPEQRKKAARTRKANKDGQAVALKLISDPAYRRNLKTRLREGTAGPIENLLWLLAYGKPREQAPSEETETRILEVREAAKKAIREAKRPRLLPAIVEGEVVERGNGQG